MKFCFKLTSVCSDKLKLIFSRMNSKFLFHLTQCTFHQFIPGTDMPCRRNIIRSRVRIFTFTSFLKEYIITTLLIRTYDPDVYRMRDVAQDMKLGLDESVITMAGLAVAKRTYQIFEQRGYDAVIMPAGLRGAYHLTEMAGGKLLYTINTRVQDMILAADPSQEERISNPVPQDVLNQLRKIPEFVRAYEPDGMKPSEFITYGVTQKLLSQFNETGWAPLETYLSNKKTNRWI